MFITFCMIGSLFAQEDESSLEEEMNDYTTSVKIQWLKNPFREYESDRYFYPWLDLDSYNSSFWMGSILNMNELYDTEKFKLDSAAFYHAPRLGTELNLINLDLQKARHRFIVGIGFLADFTFLFYKGNADQLYGKSFLFSTFLQVEPFVDYIYNHKLRIRFSPVKHICYHMGGDILGDPSLYDRSIEEFRDAGFEQVHLSVAYRWGWFTFHGGLSATYSDYSKTNIANILNLNIGAEFRFPIWGEISLIAHVVTGTNFDIINTIKRPAAGTGYTPIATLYEWTPIVSTGIGVELYRIVVGLKYELQRSRQMYSYRQMEHRLGVVATLLL